MFGNVGMGELIIIAGIALVVIGPEKFPEFAKIALRAYRDLRGYVDDIKREMAEEMKPVQRELRQLSQYNPEDYIENVAKAVAAIDDPEEAKQEGPDSPSLSQEESHSDPYKEPAVDTPSSASEDAPPSPGSPKPQSG
jgi:Tat protein translocase TatB subunit